MIVGAKTRKYDPKGYTCPLCPATFPRPWSLGGHVTSVHRDVDLDYLIARKKAMEKRRGK